MKWTMTANARAFNMIVIVIALFTWTSQAFAGGPASFHGLGDLPGGTFGSWAGGVSVDGSVVVGLSIVSCPPSDSCQFEAFRWQNGNMTGLGFLPSLYSPPFSQANGASASGAVVVGDGSSLQGTNEPFRWENGNIVGLGRIPGAWQNAHFATGVSADGQRAVGWGYNTNGDKAQAWLWENGAMAGLGYLLPEPLNPYYSAAYGISGDGNVIVGSSDSLDGAQAFRWTNGVMSGLGYLPSPFPSSPGSDIFLTSGANSASYDGAYIVGASRAFDYEGHDQTEAFRWFDGAMIGLGDLPGGAFNSYGTAVSTDGSIVVGYGTTGDGYRAFAWDFDHGMRDLRDVLIGDYGLDLMGWTLTDATGISTDGRVIVGNGINPMGDNEGWIARVPEPSSAIMLAFGGLFICTRWNRAMKSEGELA